MKIIVLGVILFVALPHLPLHAQANVSEGTLKLPSYEEGPPNLNAPFDEYATTRFNYPYVLRDNLTSHRVDRVFRAIFLENEYLRCTVLPDVGGHVYSCTDKINNVPMFYENPSIKEAAIGMRGGWAAFGLEFNFPVSHNWMTVSPVDFAYAKEKDGSASVVVSNIDRVYGMQWTVRLVLRPGSTLLEQQVTLANRSDVRHRFYWWSNAGVQAWDDTHIEYPMRYSAAHGFADVDHWPIDSNGTDLSLVKNHTLGPVSRFVHGSREPFMGIWNPRTNAGVAHFAEYAKLPAKKIWSWGSDADGLDWRRALSDNNSAYVEVQAGLFRNQETYAFLDPRQSISFTEYWMPLHELGGLSRANLTGAVYLSRQGAMLIVALNVNHKQPKSTLRILDGNQVLWSSIEDLVPERTWRGKVSVPDPKNSYSIEVKDEKGGVLISQTEGKYDWAPDSQIVIGPQQTAEMPKPSERTEDKWLQIGMNDELNGRLLIAAEDYRDGLAAFPRDQALTIAAGRLDTVLLQYSDAVRLLETAQARDTTNTEIGYYLGLAYEGLDDLRDARLAYESAARMPLLRAAASLKLGEMEARSENLVAAEDWITQALHNAPDDLRTAEELTAIDRANGHLEEAHQLAARWYLRYPTSDFLAEELGVPQMRHLAAEPERVLNVAAEYMRLGRYETALTILSRPYPPVPAGEMEPGAVAPSASPLVAYYRSFCLQKLDRPYLAEAGFASHLPISYVFPSGSQTAVVLQAAVNNNPKDATALYLLGMLQFSTGMVQQAEEHWEHAHNLDPTIPGLDANRGYSRLTLDADPKGALAAFQEGLRNDPANDAIYMGMDQALSSLHRPAAEFVAVMKQYPDKADLRAKLVYELVLHHAEAGSFDAGEDLLRNRFFPREEGGTNVREVWIEFTLMRLESLAANGKCVQALTDLSHLNQSKPGMSFTLDGLDSIIKEPRVQYRAAIINRTCGHHHAASAILTKLADSKDDGAIVWAESAARLLPGYDQHLWHDRLTAALRQSELVPATNSYGLYKTGLLQGRLGDISASQASFQKAFLAQDQRLSYHLTRSALR